MALEGLIVAGSSRGSWEITDEGKAEFARLQQKVGGNGDNGDDDEPSDWEFGSDPEDESDDPEATFEVEEPEKAPVKGKGTG